MDGQEDVVCPVAFVGEPGLCEGSWLCRALRVQRKRMDDARVLASPEPSETGASPIKVTLGRLFFSSRGWKAVNVTCREAESNWQEGCYTFGE